MGDSYFFVDILDDGGHDGFNDKDLYGEWYPTLSFSKLSGTEFQLGPIRDIALIGGINFGADADIFKYLPGVRASWQVPGFAFLNTDWTAFINANSGVKGGGAPRTSSSVMFDVSWALPFSSAANHSCLAVMPSTSAGRGTSSAIGARAGFSRSLSSPGTWAQCLKRRINCWWE